MSDAPAPEQDTDSRREPTRWYESLHFRLSLSQILVLVFIVGATIMVLVVVERALLLKQGYELAGQLGNRVVSELRERTVLAEAVTVLLANYGEQGQKPSAIMRDVPALIDYEQEENFIAGGGLWPEPYAFEPERERFSFFWGRNAQGVLEFYDDYNDPQGSGYHNEEWYVPARYYQPGTSFWSKSYMDPYSYQPMVTCTVPMWRDGQFIGVATTDLKLDGLDSFFRDSAHVTGGYIFALDRNNKFLSFPDPGMVKKFDRDAHGNKTEEYLQLNSVAGNLPSLGGLATELGDFNRKLIEDARALGSRFEQLVGEIDRESYQISREEAELLAALILRPPAQQRAQSLEIGRVMIKNDPLLGDSATAMVFLMPRTYWKVVIVFPSSRFYGLADMVTLKVSAFVVAIELTALIIMFMVIRLLLIRPIDRMSERVRAMAEGREVNALLDESSRDELGALAHEFNVRTHSLSQMHREQVDSARALYEAKKSQLDADRAADRARIESRAKSEFLAIMSHEIRTPMNGVLGMAELLADTPLDAHQDRYLSSIRSSGQALLRVINDILDYSKIDAGKMEIETVHFDLENLVEEITMIFSPRVSESGIHFLAMIKPGTSSLLRGDPTRIRQILVNLIGNAFKFTHDGEIMLKVSASRVSDSECLQLRFEVRDTGIGISEDQQKRLFSPFSQADASTTRNYGGSGLGLSISRRLAELMGGDAGVESVEGDGSTFWFTVRVRPSDMPESGEQAEREARLRGRRLLLAGEHAFNAGFSELAEAWGMEVAVAADADSAMRTLEQALETACGEGKAFDLLMANEQPERDTGTTLLRRIVDDSRFSELALLLLVGHELQRPTDFDGAVADRVTVLENPVTSAMLRDQWSDSLGFHAKALHRDVEEEGSSTGDYSLSVLVAEDNQVNRMVINGLLKRIGLDCDNAENGKEAVDCYICKDGKHDLILMDCEMPVMDGYEATQRIRRWAQQNEVARPVIVALSAHAVRERIDMAFDAGVDDYLTKPVSRDDVERLLSKYFSDSPEDV